ncbi:MAG: trypsin-like peptidase domain-containing protein, partial [Alphaproteobacteria bacterium]|nr:trypsin-like peptidase domain-containing protein [Alphaproteobacteria bacterium]
RTDIALLQIESTERFPYLALGDSDTARVGDWVVAIGNPFGLGGTTTSGIVSARGRNINSGPYLDYIQIDAPINRGNSGGPLFNQAGEVIGVNTAIYSPNGGSVGIGFAIPVNLVADVIGQLRDSGQVTRAWLGVRIQKVGPDIAESFGLEKPRGALVVQVTPGSPAENSGLLTGDIILAFDGKPIKRMKQLPRLVAATAPGSQAN